MGVIKIVSGGQTGADQGGLDAAIACGVAHSGWCPKGRRAENGVIAARYQLRETKSSSYLVRTEANVIDADATVLFTLGKLSGGSLRTAEFAQQYSRPWVHFQLEQLDDAKVVTKLRCFLIENKVEILNVAGGRESQNFGLQQRVFQIMSAVLQDEQKHV